MANSHRPLAIDPLILQLYPSARTPGPLGLNDQADPNRTTMLGDTPGPLGVNDLADVSHYRSPNAGATNFPLSYGLYGMGKSNVLGCITLERAQEMALKISTCFEGGKSMNYQALADDFDGQGTSFGLIQWNFGQHTLGPLLKKMMISDESSFGDCFRADGNYDILKTALTNDDKETLLLWARHLIKNNRKAWANGFKKLGSNDTFNKIQREEAASQYHVLVKAVIKTLRMINPILFSSIEFRSYAAMFDLCVQQHGLSKAILQIKTKLIVVKPWSQNDAMKIVVTERGRSARKEYQSDCISRRMGILTGTAFKSVENGIQANRKNSKLTLIYEFGETHVKNI
jgi:hypothetical protein